MKAPQDIIIAPVITEKSMAGIATKKYTFKVACDANKIEIAKAIEEIFNVHVTKVNTANVKSKPKRQRYVQGRTRTWKKAIVTLAEGDKIELFASQD